ncbi:hypothetical protein FDA25_02465 [Clostridium botulinum]|nr:hypothetical protein [Clostridium botulinum]NFH71478.1 hypothetical protein [Clostridium botulinum]NFI79781.1 hypothetical protein [Clostridium botulinum]NFJ70909.1 hypothetical protein [Clostridium botulinum]NFM10020.1 hypothetical protein [Clostridium botulinum]
MITKQIENIKNSQKEKLEQEIRIRKILEKNKYNTLTKEEQEILLKVDKELKSKDINKYYLLKHVKIAGNVLDKIINNKFIDYENINFKWSDTIDMKEVGYWINSDNTITISPRFLIGNYLNVKNENKELIGIIQHELIHAFIDKNHNELKLNVSTDASPMHQGIITFFNSRGCNIGSNGDLKNVFKSRQKRLYRICVNKDIIFNDLIFQLEDWQQNLSENIEKFNGKDDERILEAVDKIIKNEKLTNLTKINVKFFENCEKSYVKDIEYIDHSKTIKKHLPNFNEEFKTITFNINLGMDCNSENFNEFINNLINNYKNNMELT